MKKVILTLAAVFSMSVSALAASSSSDQKVGSVGYYLNLTENEAEIVEKATANYREALLSVLDSEEAMHQLTIDHLKLMSRIMTHEQYKDYLVLLNFTLLNNDIIVR